MTLKIGKKFVTYFGRLMILICLSLILNDSVACASSHRNTCVTRIFKVIEKHFNECGIWPSVAIGQAFVESGLYSGGRNLFGVRGCSGLSVEEATERYLQCLQNQYFRGEANFAPTPEQQLAIIMKGGRYCEGQYPGGSYYNNVLNSIDRHGWRRHDETLRKKLQAKKEKKERKKRQRKPFHVTFSDKLCPGTCRVDPEWIKKGSTIIYPGGIVEATSTKRGLKNTIICGSKRVIFPQTMDRPNFFDLSKLKIDLSVYEDAKG